MLAPEDALLLDRLTLSDRRVAVSPTASGVRRARTRGAGIEFHEYRPYQVGDDPRAIDWTVEARLRQLVVRVSRGEGQLRLHAVIDTSASMGIGSPTKLACATRLAAALCYLAAEHRDAAGVSSFGETLRTSLPPAEGRGQLFRALEVLATFVPRGRSAIDRSLQHYAAASRGPGLVAVFSDYFEPGAGLRGLQYLLHRGLTPAVVQMVAPEEISPELDGQTELVDVEAQNDPPLAVDADVLAAYRRRMAEHEGRLREFSAAHGCAWIRLRSDMTFRQALSAMESSGIVGASA